MKLSDNHVDREWAEERVEAYVDGELGRNERHRFELELRRNQELAVTVDVARGLKSSLRTLGSPECPPEATARVLELARAERNRLPRRDVLHRLSSSLRWRPAVARTLVLAVTVAALVAAGVLLLREPSPQAAQSAEVQTALNEVKLALAYVSYAGRETGVALREQVVNRHVIAPIRKAIDPVAGGTTAFTVPRPDDAGSNNKTG